MNYMQKDTDSISEDPTLLADTYSYFTKPSYPCVCTEIIRWTIKTVKTLTHTIVYKSVGQDKEPEVNLNKS